MKVYIAKDWTGPKVFAEPPKLMKCGGMPDIWSGHRLPFNIEGSYVKDEISREHSFVEDEIPERQYIEREIWWSIVNRIK